MAHEQHDAVPIASPSHWESAGKLPPFASFATDLHQPGALERAAEQIAYRNEIILVCGDGSACERGRPSECASAALMCCSATAC